MIVVVPRTRPLQPNEPKSILLPVRGPGVEMPHPETLLFGLSGTRRGILRWLGGGYGKDAGGTGGAGWRPA